MSEVEEIKPEDLEDIQKVEIPQIDSNDELAFSIEDFISEKQYQRFLKEIVRVKLNKSILEASNENYNKDERILLSKLKASLKDNLDEMPISRKEFYWLEENGFAERVDLDLHKLTDKIFNRENLADKHEISQLDNKFFYLEYMDILKRLKLPVYDKDKIVSSLNKFMSKRLNLISIYAASTLTDDKSLSKIKLKLSYEEQALFDTMVELVKAYKLYIRKKILDIDSGVVN